MPLQSFVASSLFRALIERARKQQLPESSKKEPCAATSCARRAQVIEKAYKKLRLDALVIQQGRLTENTKGANKDDLLAMVRYGAEMVFSGGTVRPFHSNHKPSDVGTHGLPRRAGLLGRHRASLLDTLQLVLRLHV